MQNDYAFASPFGRLFEFLAQFQFLPGEQFLTEASHLPERRRVAKNKRPCQQLEGATQHIPKAHDPIGFWVIFVQPNGASSCQAASSGNRLGHRPEQPGTWPRVCIHKNKPVAAGGCRAAIPRSPDLVDGFEDHPGTRPLGHLSRAIGRIVVAYNQFCFPASGAKRTQPGPDRRQRIAQQPFFVERWHDNGNQHALIVRQTSRNSTVSTRLKVLHFHLRLISWAAAE